MTKAIGDTIAQHDWFGEILDVATSDRAIQTDAYASVRLDADHYELLTERLRLLPSTLIRTGIETVLDPNFGRGLCLPVPFCEGGKLFISEVGGLISPERSPLVWRPQAGSVEYFPDAEYNDAGSPEELVLVREFIAASLLAGERGDFCQALLDAVGFPQHYAALAEGVVELHRDPWDMMVAAQGREIALFESAKRLAGMIVKGASPERVDSLLRSHEPCLPSLFVCLPFAAESAGGVVGKLVDMLGMRQRRLVLTLSSEDAHCWAWWEAVKAIHYQCVGLDVDFAVRVLPSTHVVVAPDGMPCSVSPRLFLTRFGSELYESLPLRRVDESKTGMDSETLWRHHNLEFRAGQSAVEMGTLEITTV